MGENLKFVLPCQPDSTRWRCHFRTIATVQASLTSNPPINSANFGSGSNVGGASNMEKASKKRLDWWSGLLGLALLLIFSPTRSVAQGEPQDDPPNRVARLGYLEGSVSFQPAGETDWVEAVNNRPMTTGDRIWADRASRAELQLGSAVIRLSANTGVSFLNLDDHTVQVQLSSGSIDIRVRRLNRDDVFEIDTPNLAFSVYRPGSYRLEASEDGTYTVASIRAGDAEATGNGQTYSLHAGQRGTFNGTDSLNADVEQIGGPDQFDNWAASRERRYDDSRSAQYLSRDVVGYEDLDENGDWRDDSNYGHVWFPNQTPIGWAPYREGHWDWIDPWGYTWVDDAAWGYAPFHYGRWVNVGGRWGWVAGPPTEEPVYAPALVVFIGAGSAAFGENVGWFPLGPREVYVPSYPVSRGYMNQVNISNTTVSTTTITNVYNTTVINRTTNITNVTYVNRNVQGAVTAVPQHAFASAQPVARAAVAVNAQQIAGAPVNARVAVSPTQQAVLGSKAATANRVTAPPAAVMNRPVVAKATPPPQAVPFAKQQQAMAAHPGVPLAKREMQTLRPASTAATHPMVKQAPPGKPATPAMNRPGSQPPANTPGGQAAPNNRPGESQPPGPQAPNDRPPSTQPSKRPEPNRAEPSQTRPNNRPGESQPSRPQAPNDRPPSTPSNRREPNRAEPSQTGPNNRPGESQPPRPQAPNDRSPSTPSNRPEPNHAEPSQAPPNNRQESARPPEPPLRNDRPSAPPQNTRPEDNRRELQKEPPSHPSPAAPTAQPEVPPEPHRPPPPPLTPEEKKRQEQQQKQDEKPPQPPN